MHLQLDTSDIADYLFITIGLFTLVPLAGLFFVHLSKGRESELSKSDSDPEIVLPLKQE